MHVYYSPFYYADIGDRHIFPIRKFEKVRDQLCGEGTLGPENLKEPAPASLTDALLVHSEDYLMRLCAGDLTQRELRKLGLPWSESLVRRSFYAVGGTIAAARVAVDEGVGSNLAGGTHHAFADRGEGFCVLNDVAIAIEVMRRDDKIKRALVIDCDVHQGNGTATIFATDPDVFTFSIHAAKNYPLFKARSTIDVELADGTSDQVYLQTLSHYLPILFQENPEIVFYLAGADPYTGDKLGRLSVSKDGLLQRDRIVLRECFKREIPIVTVMSGGYAADINDTVEIHCNTLRTVSSIYGSTHNNTSPLVYLEA